MKARRPRDSERGAVLVETALVAGIILTFLLFSVQIGILGFLQITADAASFVGARVATLSTASPGPYTAGIFSQVKASDVSTAAPQPAPTATVPVDYTYNNPQNPNYANSQYNRNGGYSELQPELQKVSVKPSKVIHLDGMLATVSGSDTEPVWNECGVHFNVAGTTSACGSSGNPAVNYFQLGENTPPYYVGFNEFQHCEAPMPWGAPTQSAPNFTLQASGGSDTRSTCPSATEYLGLGVAERLDADNWSRMNPGAGDPANSTFGEAACHQRIFANLASFFNAYPTLDQIYYHYYPSLYQQYQTTNTTSFKTWQGFESGPSGADALGHAADTYINDVYTWDVIIKGGEPLNSPVGAYPTSPGSPCI